MTIEFGNFDDGNEIGNVETSFGEVAAPTGGPSKLIRILKKKANWWRFSEFE